MFQCVTVCCSERSGPLPPLPPVFPCVLLCCIVLQCVEVFRSVPAGFPSPQFSLAASFVATRCSVLQCVKGCCRAPSGIPPPLLTVTSCRALCCIVLHCVVLCCVVLHCVALCCTVLYCVALCCIVLHCACWFSSSSSSSCALL